MKKSGSVNCSDVSNSLWPLRLYSPPSFSVHVILQTRILECVSIPFSRESSQLRDQTWVSCTAGGFFTEPPGKPSLSEVSEVTQSCPTLCDPMDCSPPHSFLHGILQARVLEWVAISFSRGSSRPGIEPVSPAFQADALTSELPGKLPHYPCPKYVSCSRGTPVSASSCAQRTVSPNKLKRRSVEQRKAYCKGHARRPLAQALKNLELLEGF